MKNIDNFTACDLLFNLYRWVDQGFDPTCYSTDKLGKVFSSVRHKELKKYFVKYPLVRQQFHTWLKRMLVDSEDMAELPALLSDLFSTREKTKFKTLITLCNEL